jgi:hypothetical protein
MRQDIKRLHDTTTFMDLLLPLSRGITFLPRLVFCSSLRSNEVIKMGAVVFSNVVFAFQGVLMRTMIGMVKIEKIATWLWHSSTAYAPTLPLRTRESQ